MTYTPLLIAHICGGLIAVLSGSMALLVRKGSRPHRRSGDVFVISMLSMSAAGAWLALTKSQPINVVAGLFTFYLVATAWLTVRRKQDETGLGEYALLVLGLATGIGSMIVGWQRATGPKGAGAGAGYFIFGSLTLLFASGDVRMLIRGGVSGARRMVRHLWRMCLALLVAVASLFIGTASDPVLRRSGLRATLFSKAVRHTHLPEVPVIIVAVLTIFWLCRVAFTDAYKKPKTKVALPIPERQTTDAHTRLAI